MQRISDDVTVDCWRDIHSHWTPEHQASVCDTICPMAEGGLSLFTEAALVLRTSQICSHEHLLIRGSHQASTGILRLLWLIWVACLLTMSRVHVSHVLAALGTSTPGAESWTLENPEPVYRRWKTRRFYNLHLPLWIVIGFVLFCFFSTS